EPRFLQQLLQLSKNNWLERGTACGAPFSPEQTSNHRERQLEGAMRRAIPCLRVGVEVRQRAVLGDVRFHHALAVQLPGSHHQRKSNLAFVMRRGGIEELLGTLVVRQRVPQQEQAAGHRLELGGDSGSVQRLWDLLPQDSHDLRQTAGAQRLGYEL